MLCYCILIVLVSPVNGQIIYEIDVLNETVLNIIPGCPSFLEDAFDIGHTTLPDCFCDRYFDPENDAKNLIQIKCLYINNVDGIQSAIKAVSAAGAELAFLSIEGIELPDGLPARFFQQLNATPSHLILKHCTENQTALKISDDLFLGSQDEKVKLFSITGCRLNFVPGTIKKLNSLKQLYLKDTGLIKIKSDDFTGLKELRILDLQHNWLNEIPISAFKNMKELRVLYIGHNLLNETSFAALKDLDQLAVLSLSHNMIQSLAGKPFSNLKNLKSLILSENWIPAVPLDAFSDLPNLFQLLLDYNVIRSENLSFEKQFPLNVTILNLANNFLTTVPNFSNGLWPNLNFLILSNNDIRTVGKQSLKGLNHLQMLMLNSNYNLTKIENGAFKDLKFLQVLDLSGSSLNDFHSAEYFDPDSPLTDLSLYNAGAALEPLHLEPNSFTALSHLQRLNLGANQLTALPVGLFDTLKNLTTVHLEYNNFDCSEPKKLTYVVQWLRKQRDNFRDAQEYRMGRYPACSQPEELRDLPLVAMSLESEQP